MGQSTPQHPNNAGLVSIIHKQHAHGNFTALLTLLLIPRMPISLLYLCIPSANYFLNEVCCEWCLSWGKDGIQRYKWPRKHPCDWGWGPRNVRRVDQRQDQNLGLRTAFQDHSIFQPCGQSGSPKRALHVQYTQFISTICRFFQNNPYSSYLAYLLPIPMH